jgi:hypothetical protein
LSSCVRSSSTLCGTLTAERYCGHTCGHANNKGAAVKRNVERRHRAAATACPTAQEHHKHCPRPHLALQVPQRVADVPVRQGPQPHAALHALPLKAACGRQQRPPRRRVQLAHVGARQLLLHALHAAEQQRLVQLHQQLRTCMHTRRRRSAHKRGLAPSTRPHRQHVVLR